MIKFIHIHVYILSLTHTHMYIHTYKLLSLQSMYALYVWHVVDSATLAEMTLS